MLKNKSNKKIRNFGIGLMAMIMGLITAFGGVLLLLEERNIIEKNQTVLKEEMQQCKAFGASKGFRSVEKKRGEITFYKNNLEPKQAYSSLIGMQSVALNCRTMNLASSCMGWGCDKVENITNEESMPFYFTLKEKYERVK